MIAISEAKNTYDLKKYFVIITDTIPELKKYYSNNACFRLWKY